MSNDLEVIANMFLAYVAGDCLHRFRFDWRKFSNDTPQKCYTCQEWWYKKEAQPTDYLHDSNAMLDRVIPKTAGLYTIQLWAAIDVRYMTSSYTHYDAPCVSFRDMSRSDALCKSIYEALRNSPLWDEFIQLFGEVK